jgi:hypothetical protein
MGRGKKHTAEQIVNLLRQVEVSVANGKTLPQACKEASRFHRVPRTHGIKRCLQRACRNKNALSRRPTADAYESNEGGKR